MLHKYKIADVVFTADFIYALSTHLLKKYEYSGDEPAELNLAFSMDEISAKALDYKDMPLPYVENTLVFRAFCEHVLANRNGLIFHSSAIAVDGNAYLFTAPSGTGKSTHTRLWRELLGNRAVMVNDDKPLIRMEDDGFYVYGTPWNGKHGLDTDCKVKIKAICQITRGEQNHIEPLSSAQMLPVVLNQTLRPQNLGQMDNLLELIEKMLGTVKTYRLKCNISLQAAQLSYKTMSEGV